jgi:hypothetical protein
MYTLIALVAGIDGQAVPGRLSGAVPERVIGGVLAGQGFLNLVLVIGAIVMTLTARTPVAGAALANHIVDVLITPAWMTGGVLLWWRRALGYVASLGLLLQGSLLISAANILLLRSFLSAAPVAPASVGAIFAGGLVCFIPLALCARGVVSRRSTSPA